MAQLCEKYFTLSAPFLTSVQLTKEHNHIKRGHMEEPNNKNGNYKDASIENGKKAKETAPVTKNLS